MKMTNEEILGKGVNDLGYDTYELTLSHYIKWNDGQITNLDAPISAKHIRICDGLTFEGQMENKMILKMLIKEMMKASKEFNEEEEDDKD